MQTASRMQVPGDGANHQTPPFEINWPDASIEDSQNILSPQTIVNEFRDMDEPFCFHKFMLDHLTDLVQSNFFESYTKKGLEKFIGKYYGIADIILKLEKHSADRDLRWNIDILMRIVLRKDAPELSQMNEAIKAIATKYGSLTNGLHHFQEQYRRNLTQTKG